MYYTPNESLQFSLFHFYFLAKDFLLYIETFHRCQNITMEETMSHISYLGPSSYFI